MLSTGLRMICAFRLKMGGCLFRSRWGAVAVVAVVAVVVAVAVVVVVADYIG